MYGSSLGSWPSCDGLFLRLSARLADEARLSSELLGLQGMLDLLMASAAAAAPPVASGGGSSAGGRGRRGAGSSGVGGQDASAAGDLDA
jgi:hypothetical protein